eukprot:TRINITY_DN125_c0_g1_i1.p1 TRINITY_DN125_c0_g1~~TRINITY_DN125_c0_g1_i1.p1  ORF type:complete len:413 (+),score=115.41 TRINITY_DN125_c0_g1_i1:51-1289(+)
MIKEGLSENEEIEFFRSYLRIKTVHPVSNEAYNEAAIFLKSLGEKIGLKNEIIEISEGKKIVILTWEGSQPSLPTLLLNSHIDVVPVEEKFWKYDPFSAHMDENGDIFARGTQDMKSVGISYLMAIMRLKKKGFTPLRTIHVSFVPEEEVGGELGMKLFIETETFKKLNVGLSLDEGYASEDDSFHFFYGERSPWWLIVEIRGQTGHASLLLDNTAACKLGKITNSINLFREEQFQKSLEKGKTIGDCTSVNITITELGVKTGEKYQINVIPSYAKLGVDIRIPPTYTDEQFEEIIKKWLDYPEVTHHYQYRAPIIPASDISDKNKWYSTFRETCITLGIKTTLEIFPAATDSRFLRSKGITAFGFSPINNTKRLLHQHDEYLNKDVYLKGISIYETFIINLSSLEKHSFDK